MPLSRLLLCLAASGSGLLAQALPLQNADFEHFNAQNPKGWHAVLGAQARLEQAPQGLKGKGLQIIHPDLGARSHVLSEPLKLEVGQLYRLKGWIKSQGVKTNPNDRYPTGLGACLSMASFPFTNASPTVAGTDAREVAITFFATQSEDQVRLDLGRNGSATGSAIFDEITLEKLSDITQHIPMEQVRWAGKGFRYEDSGWTYVHIEGDPYPRGHQYGRLLAFEIVRFMEKLATLEDKTNPEKGWESLRKLTNALTLRKFDTEYLEEMKGMADGANQAGATFKGRKLDLLDFATLNSSIDFSSLDDALRVAPDPLSGRIFENAEAEAAKAGKGDHCSAFVATKSATRKGRFVTGQMFMWNGYSGAHWDLVVDIQPTKGHRLVMQSFPGGIHSGADWYINGSGLVIGETTVGQTPFKPEGTPQSNRIRKAVQYASSIDEVASILKEKNNGLYTNDWVIADAKTDEGAVFLLGSDQTRLWRTGSKGKPADTPGNLKDFVWAVNNNRDLNVRKEYVANPDNFPVDLAFNTWNRDIASWNWFQEKKGNIDLKEAVDFWATSPIQRPHSCDGKLTTAEMAEKLMFIGHQGKTTLREKWVGGRFIQNLPNAIPHLTYGYATFSPIFVTEKLQALKNGNADKNATTQPKLELAKDVSAFDKSKLWSNSLFPATEKDFWLSSADAGYHATVRRTPEDANKAFEFQKDFFAELNARYLFLAQREGEETVLKTRTRYDQYSAYQVPRIKGLFALHQLRLKLGNDAFSKIMKDVHQDFGGKDISTEIFWKEISQKSGQDLKTWMEPWLNRTGLPDPKVEASLTSKPEGGFEVLLNVSQNGPFYPFICTVEIQTAKARKIERITIEQAQSQHRLVSSEKPRSVTFNAGSEIPVASATPVQLPNLLD